MGLFSFSTGRGPTSGIRTVMVRGWLTMGRTWMAKRIVWAAIWGDKRIERPTLLRATDNGASRYARMTGPLRGLRALPAERLNDGSMEFRSARFVYPEAEP